MTIGVKSTKIIRLMQLSGELALVPDDIGYQFNYMEGYIPMKTYMAKAEEVKRKWYVVDATGMSLGRLASRVASVLRGKHKTDYTPNVDTGDHVIVINCSKVKLTGNKLEDKYYYYHTGYVGGLKQIQYKHLMANKPHFAVYEAIRGMLPKNALGRQMIKKLRVYKDAEHNHEAQKPEILTF